MLQDPSEAGANDSGVERRCVVVGHGIVQADPLAHGVEGGLLAVVVGHVGDLGGGGDHAEEREEKDVYCFFHIVSQKLYFNTLAAPHSDLQVRELP